MSDRIDDLVREVQKFALREKEAGLPPQGILLIGQSGAGKSALINTLVAALCGDYIQKQPFGKGHAGSKSLDLTRLPRCGVEREDLPEKWKKLFDDCLENLPTIFDFAGLGDVDSPDYRMILELLLRGFVPPKTSVKSLCEDMEKFGVVYLRQIYREVYDDNKIDKIVFVQSGSSQPATNLARCINAVRDLVDPATRALLCPSEVFLVVTKRDLVDCQDDLLNETAISREDFDAAKHKLAALFNLEGSLKHNSIMWTNYTDRNGYPNPDIDETALEFLVKVMKHRKVDRNPKPNITPVWLSTQMFYRAKQLAKDYYNTNIQINPTLMVITVIVAVIVFFILKSFFN